MPLPELHSAWEYWKAKEVSRMYSETKKLMPLSANDEKEHKELVERIVDYEIKHTKINEKRNDNTGSNKG